MAAYSDLVDAQAYFDERLHEVAWSQSSEADQTKSLLAATRIIDTLGYKGYKHTVWVALDNDPDADEETIAAAEASQENEFPRGADTEVPEQILWACYEIAYALLDGVDPDLELENLAIQDHGIGSVRSSFARRQEPLEHIINGVPSATAWKYIKPFLRDGDHIRFSRVS